MEVIGYGITKMLLSPEWGHLHCLKKEMLWWRDKRSQSIKQYRNFSGSEYFLAFSEDALDQALLSQCAEMLMKLCFARGASASSLLTAFPSLLVSRTNASSCANFSCGAVTNNAKLSQASLIYSAGHSVLGLSHTFSIGWVKWSDAMRTSSRQCLHKLNLFTGKGI